MNYYLAPLEGNTTHIFRRGYHKYFRPMDKYFTPFIVPHTKKDFNFKEKNEILPDNSPGQYLVPQIMTNCPEDFIRTAKKLAQFGYEEVNLNLGCPSGTVVSKGRGSGFLAYQEKLDRFFEEIFEQCSLRISVKTRIGMKDPKEFSDILKIYNRYPLEEVIIHPRLQTDYYKNTPNMEVFSMAYEESIHPLCYNGDLFTLEDLNRIAHDFPELDRLMLGRGILRNPKLINQAEHIEMKNKEVLREFHDYIFLQYCDIFSGERTILYRMKEFWSYYVYSFDESEFLWKKLKKVQKLSAYEIIVSSIFHERLPS